MRRFEVIEHTADTGIRAYGSSLSEAFENCALGMMSLILNPQSVRAVDRLEVQAEGRDSASLLVSWLAEILFKVESERWAFREFGVDEISESRVRGWGLGEPLDLARHEIQMEVKAPTYHMLELKEEAGRWIVQVIFDV